MIYLQYQFYLVKLKEELPTIPDISCPFFKVVSQTVNTPPHDESTRRGVHHSTKNIVHVTKHTCTCNTTYMYEKTVHVPRYRTCN
jgi:hypothetical protein